MAAKKNNTTKRKFEFVRFKKVGDEVSGKITSFGESSNGLFLVLDGKKAVGMNKVNLARTISMNQEAVMSAKKIRILYKSNSKGISGNVTKVFSVFCDGKELLSSAREVDSDTFFTGIKSKE